MSRQLAGSNKNKKHLPTLSFSGVACYLVSAVKVNGETKKTGGLQVASCGIRESTVQGSGSVDLPNPLSNKKPKRSSEVRN